jgi:hypothetical protein
VAGHGLWIGLECAFDRLGPRADRRLEGLRGRGFFLLVILPIFEEHYATSGLAGLVLLALWLFLSNAMVLIGYRVALKS